MTPRNRFAIFVAGPLAVVAIAGATAFTAGVDSTTLNGQREEVQYLYPASGDSGSGTVASIAMQSGATSATTTSVSTLYGHLPEWYQVSSGTGAVPGGIQVPGDILYINSFSNDADENGNIVTGLQVQGNIVNLPEVRNSYASCIVPLRVYNTTDDGDTWTDITATVWDTPSGQPYYLDCTTGEFSFTLRGAANMDEHYVVTIELGGTITPLDAASPLADPQFVFQSKPIAYAPLNDLLP